MKIKEITPEYRPRERLLRNGVEALSDAELLAVVLQKGRRGENVVELANRLVASGLGRLGEMSLAELQKVSGIGLAKAMQIAAVFELVKRFRHSERQGKAITCAEDVFLYARNRLKGDKEYFMVIYLDTKNKVIKDEIVSVGTLNSALVHPREVFRTAVREGVNSIVLVHNHPSGDCAASDEDREITEVLTKAGEIVGVRLVDHVVVGDGYESICRH